MRRYATGSALFVLVGLVAGVVHPHDWKAWSASASFALLAFVFVKESRNRRPRLILDEQGIWGAGFPRKLVWDEFTSISETTTTAFAKVHVLRVVPRHGEPRRVVISNLRMTPAEIMERVQRFHPVSART